MITAEFLCLALRARLLHAYAYIIFPSLEKLAERVYPESQYGFRSQNSITDMTFAVQQLEENFKKTTV